MLETKTTKFRSMIRARLASTGYSAVKNIEDGARAMAKLGATHAERAEGEWKLSVINECLDERDKL